MRDAVTWWIPRTWPGVKVDHRESDETQVCHVTLARSDYREVIAVESLRRYEPQSLLNADAALAASIQKYLSTPVPSTMAANIVLVTSDMRILCAERSHAVDSAMGLWTVGVFETMKWADLNSPGGQEDIYSLNARGLREELDLLPHEYDMVHVTWLGIYKPILRGHLLGVARLRIDAESVIERARMAHSSHEHSTFEWKPLTRGFVRSFLNAPRGSPINGIGFSLRVDNREWLDQSRLAVREAWRFRAALLD